MFSVRTPTLSVLIASFSGLLALLAKLWVLAVEMPISPPPDHAVLKVYLAAITELRLRDEFLVVDSAIGARSTLGLPRSDFTRSTPIAAFMAANRIRVTSSLHNATLDSAFKWIRPSELRHITPRRDFWTIFERRYPGHHGVVSLSRIGFSPHHDRALVYVEYGCGWLCGGGYYVELQEDRGTRTVIRQIRTWVS